MKKYIYLLLVLIICLGCKEQNNIEYKIVDMNEAQDQMRASGYVNDMIFKNKIETSINDSEVKLLKSILKSTIDTYNSKHSDENKISVCDYKFFFIPVLDDKNEKLLYTYAYCSSKESDLWNLSDWFSVRDGGNCYFMTAINLTKRLEGWIIPNGEA